jgi:hypothetical protein
LKIKKLLLTLLFVCWSVHSHQRTANSQTTDAETISTSGPVDSGGGSQVIYAKARKYGLANNGRFKWDAIFTRGSKTITCADCSFRPTDVGLVVFGTNAHPTGYTNQSSSQAILAQTTIASVINAATIVVNGSGPTTSCTYSPGTNSTACLLVWGSLEDTALASAWADTITACGTLQFPGLNNYGTGPSVMLVSTANFNTPYTANEDGTGCSLGPEANRQGLSIHGVDVNSSYIIPVPNFRASGCTAGSASNACMFTVFNGLNLSNFTVWGGGNSVLSGMSSKIFVELDPLGNLNPDAGNNSLQRMVFMGLGANSAGSGLGTCVQVDGGGISASYFTIDGCGNIGLNVKGGYFTLNAGDGIVDNGTYNVKVSTGATLNSVGTAYGFTSSPTNPCDVWVAGGTFSSTNDTIGFGQTTGLQNGICNGSFGAKASTVYLSGSTVSVGSHPGNNALLNTLGSVNAVNSIINAAGNGSCGLNNSASFFDLGGNTITGATPVCHSGPDNVFGSASVGGTLLTTRNLSVPALNGWGTGAAVAISAPNSDSLHSQFTITTGRRPSANPTVTITPPKSFFVAQPLCIASQTGGTGAPQFLTVGTTSSTSIPLTWHGTPSNGSTYTITVNCQ